MTANGDAISGVTLASLGAASTATVGTYALSASNAQGSGLSNYTITYVNAPTGLTVTPAALTIAANNQSKVYGTTGNLGTTGFTETGLVTANGDAISGVTLASLGAASTATVGTYSLSASNAQGSGLSNYTITYVNAPTGLTVTPAALTIAANDQSKVYGTNGNLGTTGFTETGLVTANGDAISGVTLSSLGAASTATVGTYALSASNAQGSGLSNYTITYVNAPTGLTVTPAALTIAANNQSKVYGTNGNLGTTGFTETGLVTANGDAISGVTLSSLGAASTATVGTYALSASNAQGSGLSNYTITYVNAPTGLTVTPAALTIRAENQSMSYGGSLPTLTVSYSGFVNGDSVASLEAAPTISLTTLPNANAGVYANAITASGAVDPNYKISYIAGALTINKANLTVKLSDVEKTYDGRGFVGGGAVTYSGFVDGQGESVLSGALVFGGSAQGAVNVGNYALTAAGLSSNNYAIQYINAALTIDPATLRVVGAEASNKTYDGANAAVVANGRLSGVIFGDNVVMSAADGAFATVDVGYGLAVTTHYTLSGAQAGNYVLLQPSGLTADILPRQLTISAEPESRYFGQPNPSLLYTVSGEGLLAGDTLSGALTTTAAASSVPGAYPILLGSLSAGSNYAINFVGAQLDVLATGGYVTADPSRYVGYVAPPADPATSVSLTIDPDSVPIRVGSQGGGGAGPLALSIPLPTDFETLAAPETSNWQLLTKCARKLLASSPREYRAASVDGGGNGACDSTY